MWILLSLTLAQDLFSRVISIPTFFEFKNNKMYKELAETHYVNHKDYKKALAAGIAMDNALKKDYTTGGSTNTHFMMSNFLKYFSYEKLPI